MQRSLFSSPQKLIVVCIHEFVAGTAASHVHKHGELLRDWTFSNIDCVRLGERKALRVETYCGNVDVWDCDAWQCMAPWRMLLVGRFCNSLDLRCTSLHIPWKGRPIPFESPHIVANPGQLASPWQNQEHFRWHRKLPWFHGVHSRYAIKCHKFWIIWYEYIWINYNGLIWLALLCRRLLGHWPLSATCAVLLQLLYVCNTVARLLGSSRIFQDGACFCSSRANVSLVHFASAIAPRCHCHIVTTFSYVFCLGLFCFDHSW